MSILGSIITGGLSLISGLLGGSKKNKPTTTSSTVNYKAMVRNAEAAGFNPLTALRNGGSAGFTATTTSGGEASPLSSVGSAIAGAGRDFMSSLSQIDPMKDKMREAQYAIMQRQLAAMSNGGMSRPKFGGVPEYENNPRANAALAGDGVDHGGLVSMNNAWDAIMTPKAGIPPSLQPSTSPGVSEGNQVGIAPAVRVGGHRPDEVPKTGLEFLGITARPGSVPAVEANNYYGWNKAGEAIATVPSAYNLADSIVYSYPNLLGGRVKKVGDAAMNFYEGLPKGGDFLKDYKAKHPDPVGWSPWNPGTW